MAMKIKQLGTVVSSSGGISKTAVEAIVDEKVEPYIIDEKGGTTYSVGTDAKLSMFGHLSSTSMSSQEDRQVYISTPVNDDGGNGSAYMPDYEAKAVRIITHGNATDRSGVNMLTKNQASIETDTTGFTATGGSTITRDTTEKYDGLASLKVVTTTTVLSGVDLVEVKAIAGVHYSFSCKIKCDGNIIFRMYAYDDTTDIGVASGTIGTTSGWTDFKIQDFIAPAGTTRIIIKIGTPQPSVRTVYLDVLQLESNSVSTSFAMPGDAPLSVGNYNVEWVGRKYSYNVVPTVNYVLNRLYYTLGSTMVMDANSVINVRGYKGTSEAGIKILDRTISAGTAPYSIVPNGEVYIEAPNLDYREGEEFHYVLEMLDADESHQFSIITNEDNAQPWRAVDGQRFELKAMIPSDALYANLIVTSPTAGDTGISLTPTVSTIKGVSKYATFQGGTTVTVPNNTDYNTLFDIPMAPNFMGNKGSMVGTILLRHTGVGAKDIILGLGGSIIYSTAIFTTGDISVVEFALYAKNISLQTISASITGDDGVIGTNTIDLINPTSLILTAKKSVSTNIFELMGYDIFITNSDSELVGEYAVGFTEVKVKEAATQKTVYQDFTSGLSGTVTAEKKLKGSTSYNAYARHKTSSGLILPWSQSVNFKTLMDLTMTLNSGIVAGDLVEINVGESATSSDFDFHLSNVSDKFPPTAFDSGEFRFKDSLGVDLLFKVQSISGVTPNRVAKCYIETNAQVIVDSKIKLIGIGASATNVSEIGSKWVWSPANLTARAIDIDFMSLAGTDGTAISTIANTGTLGGNYTQATSTQQPTLQTRGGLRVGRFDGVDDWMESSAVHNLGAQWGLFAMLHMAEGSSTNESLIFGDTYEGDSNIAYAMSVHMDGLSASLFNGAWQKSPRSAFNADTPITSIANYNQVNLSIKRDGADALNTAYTVASSTSTSRTRIARRWDMTLTAPNMMNMDVYRIIGKAGAWTADEIGKLEGYAMWSTGRQTTLPVGHTYRDNFPTTKTLHTDKFNSVL